MVLTNEEKEEIWKSMYEQHLRLLGLYELRLYYLETMNDKLELVRHLVTLPTREREALAESYRGIFKNKKKSSTLFDITKILDKNEEYIADYITD